MEGPGEQIDRPPGLISRAKRETGTPPALVIDRTPPGHFSPQGAWPQKILFALGKSNLAINSWQSEDNTKSISESMVNRRILVCADQENS